MGRRQRTARARALALATAQQTQRQDWCRIEMAADTRTASVYLYDEIGFFGTTAAEFSEQVRSLDADTIKLHVNSPGGDVYDGVTIFNTLRSHKAKVHVIIDGLAASAASFIAMAGDRRTMMPGSTLMIHDASTVAWGTATEMRETADILDKTSDNIADIYAARCGKDPGYWRDLMLAETWFNAREAVEFGLADEVDCPPDMPGRDEPEIDVPWDLSVYRFAGRSKAPAPGVAAAEPVNNVIPPVDEPAPVVDDYDPGQRRDDQGQWSDGMPNVLATTSVQLLNGSISVDAVKAKDPGTVRISDGTRTAELSEATAVKMWRGQPDLREGMNVGDTRTVYRYDETELGVYRTPLFAVKKTSNARWELIVADPDDSADDITSRVGVQMTYNQFHQVQESALAMTTARRLTTSGGPVDVFPAGDRFGMRVRTSRDEVREMSFSEAEWGAIRRGLDVVWEGFDESAIPDDAPDDYEPPEVTQIQVPTSVGTLVVGRYGDDLSISPLSDDSWHVTFPIADAIAIHDAFSEVEGATGIDVYSGSWNRAPRRVRAQAGTEPQVSAGGDVWADIVAHLMTTDAATVADPLARLREAYQ